MFDSPLLCDANFGPSILELEIFLPTGYVTYSEVVDLSWALCSDLESSSIREPSFSLRAQSILTFRVSDKLSSVPLQAAAELLLRAAMFAAEAAFL